MSKSITFPRHPNVVYVADKRIKECGSRGLGDDVRYVCTSVQYKCTVYSTRIRRGCVSECLRSEGVSLPPTIIDIIQVQIGGCTSVQYKCTVYSVQYNTVQRTSNNCQRSI